MADTRMVMGVLLECKHQMVVYISSDSDTVELSCDICKTTEGIHVSSIFTGSVSALQQGDSR